MIPQQGRGRIQESAKLGIRDRRIRDLRIRDLRIMEQRTGTECMMRTAD